MVAIVSWGKDEALKMEEIQVEAPKSSEVRVKMVYASVCHTDISLAAKGFLIVSPLLSSPLPRSLHFVNVRHCSLRFNLSINSFSHGLWGMKASGKSLINFNMYIFQKIST